MNPRSILLVTLLVFAIRLPFLYQAIQGDEVNYLAGAEHAQIDPLHPNHVSYPYVGEMVDMRGHPHPPLNVFVLAALLAVTKTVSEIPYHAAYILFSLIAAWSALSIASRFTKRPLLATVLFLAVPAFVVNGNSLESDIPFLAFWLASIALFLAAVKNRSNTLLVLSGIAMILTAFAAYQAIVLVPILWLYLWKHARDWKPAWACTLTVPVTIAAWQLFERLSTGSVPAAVLAGYMQTYHLQAIEQKLKAAVAFTVHLGWIVFLPLSLAAFLQRKSLWLLPLVVAAAIYDPNPLFWLSIATGLVILLWCATHTDDFPAAWLLIFFAAALAIFFVGSARYLLPLALPLAILVSQRLEKTWLITGAVAGFALSLSFAAINYRHWDGYRTFAESLSNTCATKRVWINGEWGMRFYLEREGALPLLRNQRIAPGDVVVTSALSYPIPVSTAGGVLSPAARETITSAIPLRLVSLGGKSAYSATIAGLRPFDISTAPIDMVQAESLVERKPQLSNVPMNAPEAPNQIVSGIFGLESNAWRWMGAEGILLLKPPQNAAPIVVKLYIPPQSPTREITASMNGQELAKKTCPVSNPCEIRTAAVQPSGDSAALSIRADKTFSPPGDIRQLSVILTSAGFETTPGN